jgi:hypothetical protein
MCSHIVPISSAASDPTETLTTQDFRSAKVLFVPSLKRDIVFPIPFPWEVHMATTSGAPGLTVLPTLLARAEEAIELSLSSSARASS